VKLRVELCGALVKEAAQHNLVSDIKRHITKFDTVLLHSNWSSSVTTKTLKQNSNRHESTELWAKSIKHFGHFGRHFPTLHPQKSSQRVRACTAHDGAICSKNRKIVPYHRDSPNTRNGARLRSPSPIIAPACIHVSLRAGSHWNTSASGEAARRESWPALISAKFSCPPRKPWKKLAN